MSEYFYNMCQLQTSSGIKYFIDSSLMQATLQFLSERELEVNQLTDIQFKIYLKFVVDSGYFEKFNRL